MELEKRERRRRRRRRREEDRRERWGRGRERGKGGKKRVRDWCKGGKQVFFCILSHKWMSALLVLLKSIINNKYEPSIYLKIRHVILP